MKKKGIPKYSNSDMVRRGNRKSKKRAQHSKRTRKKRVSQAVKRQLMGRL